MKGIDGRIILKWISTLKKEYQKDCLETILIMVSVLMSDHLRTIQSRAATLFMAWLGCMNSQGHDTLHVCVHHSNQPQFVTTRIFPNQSQNVTVLYINPTILLFCYFNPEEGGSNFLWNVNNFYHFDILQRYPKDTTWFGVFKTYF